MSNKCIDCKWRAPLQIKDDNDEWVYYSRCAYHGFQTFIGNACPQWEPNEGSDKLKELGDI